METDETYTSIYNEGQIMNENECWNSWVHYLQMLNGLCAAGARLASNFRGLSAKLGSDFYSKECPGVKEWDTLLQAFSEATASVHAQTMPVVKLLGSTSQDHMESPYQLKVIENILSMITFQYRFCTMSCEKLSTIAESGYNKFMSDLHEVENNTLFNRIPNLGMSPSCQSDNPSLQNSIPSVFNIKNECSLQSSLNSSRANLERTIGDSKENNFYFFSQNQFIENTIPTPQDVCSLNSKDQPTFENRNNTFSLFPSFTWYSDARYLQHPANNKIANYSNSPYGSDSSHSSIGKILDNKNNRFPNNSQGNFQSKLLPKNSLIRNPSFGYCAPVVSEISQHNQLAQLRRWSEAAAHAASERQDDSGNIRRWSVPWDGGQPVIPNETTYWSEKNRSNSKERDWNDEQDSLDTAIFLLSYRTPKKVSSIPENKQPVIPEQYIKRSNVTEGAPRGYSVWNSNGKFPFLKLTESPEQ